MARVTGIGGVFFQAKSDPATLAGWYREHLGLALEDWGGAILKWSEDHAEDGGLTVWHVAGRDGQSFAPSSSGFMINYRVDDLDGMLDRLRRGGVAVLSGPEDHENGRFAWVMDPDGNKVELWEPRIWDDRNRKG